MTTFVIKPGELSLEDCRFIFENEVHFELDPACFDAINRSADTVQKWIDEAGKMDPAVSH